MRQLMGSIIALATGLAVGVPTAGAQQLGPLEGAEQDAMTDTVQHALERNPTNRAAEWVNPDTGNSGAVVPVRTFQGAWGEPCREFVTTIVISGQEEQGYGTACRQPDGSWEVVDSVGEPSPPPVRVYAPPSVPPAYYSYPTGTYGPSRIFLSFSYVYRGGRFYRGRYDSDGREFRRRYPFHIRRRIFVGPRVHPYFRWRDREGLRDGRQRRGPDERGRTGDRPGRSWSDPERPGGRGHEGRR